MIRPSSAATVGVWFVGALVVDAGAHARLDGFEIHNPGTTVAYLQVFGSTAASVTLGTTAPVYAAAVAPGAVRKVRLRTPVGSGAALSYAVTSTRTGSGSPEEACSVSLMMNGRHASADSTVPDPLSVLDDDFEEDTPADPEDRGWVWYQESTVATQEIVDGALHLVSTTGGAGGAWIYNANRGNLLHKTVSGNFDFRSRVRARDAVGTGSPTGGVPLEWRFAGINVTDPSTDSSLHIMLGGDPNGANRIEWKTTDGSISTWDSAAGSAPLDYDLRIVRQGQIFLLYYRRTDAGYALSSDVGWVLLQTIDRTDNATPARLGGAPAVAMPTVVWLSLTGGYSGPTATLDIQAWFDDVQVRSA